MFARIAHALAEPDDVGSATQRIVTLAKTVLACDSSAVWSLTPQDQLRLHAATDPKLAKYFGEMVGKVREGMAWECLRSHSTVRIADIRNDHRWPSYRAEVLRSAQPLLSAVGYSLGGDDGHLGALIVASRRAGFFTDELMELGAIFAEHAALSLEAVASEQRARNLEVALNSNRRIGMAIGILMMEHRIQEGRAFDLLRAASQNTHRKLREVAEDVILTGALPSSPRGRLESVAI